MAEEKPSPQLIYLARKLRRDQTSAEEVLWQAIRNRKLNKLKFRRQHPIKEGFILDFYCHDKKTGIELDGPYHDRPDIKEYDLKREKIIAEQGITLLRFKNHEVFKDLQGVLTKISTTLAASPTGDKSRNHDKSPKR